MFKRRKRNHLKRKMSLEDKCPEMKSKHFTQPAFLTCCLTLMYDIMKYEGAGAYWDPNS